MEYLVFSAELPLSDYHYHATENPLGVFEEQLTKPYVTIPKILEYKYSLDGLVREMESGYKHEKDLVFAVFWSMGSEYVRDYTPLSYLDSSYTHHRPHHGLTHLMRSANSQFEAICLEELFQVLNSPGDAQLYQEKTYGDEI